jgi:ketosteroid isomerase-like protein
MNTIEEGAFYGLDSIRDNIEHWASAWEDFDVIAEEFLDAGDQVVVTARHRGRGRASGVIVDARFYDVYTLRDGKITRADEYADRAEALEAAGLQESAMSQENVEVVHRYYDAWNAGGLEAVRDFWTDDFQWHDAPGMPDSAVYEGPDAVAEHFRELNETLGFMQVKVEAVAPGEDEVFVRLRVHIDAPLGGIGIDGPIYESVQVKRGKLSRIRLYLDESEARHAAGLQE